MSAVLNLLKDKEKIFIDMLEYVKDMHFEYKDDEVERFSRFVDNISVYIRTLKKIQDDINEFGRRENDSDKEVRETEQRCKALAKQIYDIDKDINDKMTVVMKEIKLKYNSSKNQQKFYDYSNNANYISESFASFDTKQ